MTMSRLFLIPLMVLLAFAWAPVSEAQRRAEVVQGVSSTQLAATVEELRISNAELRARMTGLESDKANLNGKVETLEFLLSESRNEVNRMQSDDAELERLITRLEGRISTQAATIADLERRLSALEPEPDLLSVVSDANPAAEGAFTEAVQEEAQADVVTSSAVPNGPTRIVRRSVTTVGPDGTPQVVEMVPGGQQLPQGSLGTLSASALPGEAGPLFAEAKSRLLQFDYPGAETAFRSFLEQFEGDPQAGEAQYWLAEVLYQQEAYAESGAAYTDMIRAYPDDPRAPEALAKLARSMRLVGNTEQACNALNLLPERYPNASGVTTKLAAGERVRSSCDS